MLEPFAYVQTDITLPLPIVFFGTNATCNVPGLDYMAIYNKWQDSKIRTGNSVSFIWCLRVFYIKYSLGMNIFFYYFTITVLHQNKKS